MLMSYAAGNPFVKKKRLKYNLSEGLYQTNIEKETVRFSGDLGPIYGFQWRHLTRLL